MEFWLQLTEENEIEKIQSCIRIFKISENLGNIG